MVPRKPDSVWAEILAAQRIALDALDREQVESRPGVYVLFRDGNAVYIGKSASLRATLAQLFAVQGPSAVSPFRRSVAEFLGIASAKSIAAMRYRPTPEDHAKVNRWIKDCSVVWRSCATESEAVALETRLLNARRASSGEGKGEGALTGG